MGVYCKPPRKMDCLCWSTCFSFKCIWTVYELWGCWVLHRHLWPIPKLISKPCLSSTRKGLGNSAWWFRHGKKLCLKVNWDHYPPKNRINNQSNDSWNQHSIEVSYAVYTSFQGPEDHPLNHHLPLAPVHSIQDGHMGKNRFWVCWLFLYPTFLKGPERSGTFES